MGAPDELADFYFVNAFTTSTYGGNPAAVIIPHSEGPVWDDDLCRSIAANLNQPMHSFAFLASEVVTGVQKWGERALFRLRWFTPTGVEVPFCGHATLATAAVIFKECPHLVPEESQTIVFETMHCNFYARQVESATKGGPPRIQIELPAFDVALVDDEEFDLVSKVVAKAFGRKVQINFIGIAFEEDISEGNKDYLLVEVGYIEKRGN